LPPAVAIRRDSVRSANVTGVMVGTKVA
jgi:hypothetical protein